MTSTRERKIDFIAQFDALRSVEGAVIRAVRKQGADFLTDEQLEELCDQEIARKRFIEQINRENRRRRA